MTEMPETIWVKPKDNYKPDLFFARKVFVEGDEHYTNTATLIKKIEEMERPFSRIHDDWVQGSDSGYNQALNDVLEILGK